MKKIIYSSLMISLLLSGCVEEKETDEQLNLNKEEQQLLEEIKEGNNLSITGNDLNISDEEKDYNLRLRIIDINNMFISYLLYNIPNLNNTDSYYINKYALEDYFYRQDNEVMIDILKDIENYDAKFTKEEQFLHDNLTNIIDKFNAFFEWTEDNQLFIKENDEEDSYYVFNKEKHDISSYQQKLNELNKYMDSQLISYFDYSVHFLNEKEKTYTKEELISYLNFESALRDSKDFVKQEINFINERTSSKSKKEESWNNLKSEIIKIKKIDINSSKLINIHKEYFELLNDIDKYKTYEEASNELSLLNEWYDNDDFLKDYTVENLYYIQTFIDYYKSLYFDNIE